MKQKYYPLLTAVLLVAGIFISGCSFFPQPQFIPSVRLELDRNTITVSDNTVSKDFITATITRLDNENIETPFVLKFPEIKESVYPTNADGIRIYEIPTKPLKGQNSKDTLQFKIFGKKGEAAQASFDLKVELWWNNTKIDSQDKIIKIEVS